MRTHPFLLLSLGLSILTSRPVLAEGRSPQQDRLLIQAVPVASVQDDLFPAATGALEIPIRPGKDGLGEGPSFLSLTRQYGALTGQHITYSASTKAELEAAKVQLDRSLTVPPQEAQRAFEVLLRQADFSLAIESAVAPRVLRIRSLNSTERSELKETSKVISVDQLELARRHPALQFQVAVELPHSDVRQLSNSLRSTIGDKNTALLLPAGNSHAMIVGGFGDWVHKQVRMLQAMDAAAAQAHVDRGEIVIVLVSGSAEAMAKMLTGVFTDSGTPPNQQVLLRANEATSSLLVSAPSSRMVAIRRVIAALDR
jgi:hypothetical protein